MNAIRLLLSICTFGLVGCQGTLSTISPDNHNTPQFIKRVKIDKNVDGFTQESAAQIRQFCDAMFPKLCAILGETLNKQKQPQITIEIKPSLWNPGIGPTSGRARDHTIQLNATRLAGDETELMHTLLHEMTHTIQAYPSGVPDYWREGIADYVAYEVLEETGAKAPCCSWEFPSYKKGYRCSAAFLVFLEKSCRKNIVPDLHQALRRGAYTDRFFPDKTGKPLEELWDMFCETDAFTPRAKAMLDMDKIEHDKNLNAEQKDRRFFAFVESQPGGSLTVSAIDWLRQQIESKSISGISGTSLGSCVLEHGDLDLTDSYPAQRTIRISTPDLRFRFHFDVQKQDPKSDWVLMTIKNINNRSGKLIWERK